MSLIHLRHCKKCEAAYDIEVEYDQCPMCRGIKIKEVENGERRT